MLNNPLVPGDPFSYDLKWIVRKLKYYGNQISELTQKIAGIEIPEQREITTSVLEYGDLEAAFTGEDPSPIIGKVYTINESIDITGVTKPNEKLFLNCVFVLNDDLLTWSEAYKAIPRFNNCLFIGNGNSVVKSGKYIGESEFINCVFENVSLIRDAVYVQTTTFQNCRFIGNKTIIDAQAINVVTFNNCVLEGDFTGQVIITHDTPASYATSGSAVFHRCMFESQADTLISMTKGAYLTIKDCHLEVLNGGIADFLVTDSSNPILKLTLLNNNIVVGRNPLIDIGSGYINKQRVSIIIKNNMFEDSHTQSVLSSTNFQNLQVEDNLFLSGNVTLKNNISSTGKPSVYTSASSITIPAADCPALITWANSVGGWHTDIALVNKAFQTWQCRLITDTSVTFPVTENSDGTITIDISSRQATTVGNYGRNYVSLANVVQKTTI